MALVHDWLTGLRGGEKCLEVLCQAFPDATVHTLVHRPGSVGPIIGGMRIRTSPLQSLPGATRSYRRLLPAMPLAARWWNVGEVDLVVSLSHCVAKAVRVPAGVPHVCYCFTPMRYAWEGRSAYLGGAEWPWWKRWAAGRVLDGLRDWDRATAGGVTEFVAISETVRERIERCYGRSSVVVPPPVDTDFYMPSPTPQPREGFALCVSALVPYKRTDQAIEACNASGRALVVIGEGPERARLERLAGPTVRFLGWQPDEVIRDHLRRCRALLFPGEEDFGIVPVEALACGAPVIALGRGGAAETINDPAIGRLYGEATPEALRACLDGWEAAGAPHDPVRARRRAEEFARDLFRDRLVGLLEEIAPGCRRPRPTPRVGTGTAARGPSGRVAGRS